MLLTPDIVLKAYSLGYFPMAQSKDAFDVFWVEPDLRGILPFEQFHLPRSLKKFIRRIPYRLTLNMDFAGVIKGCAEVTDMREDTWINYDILDVYQTLHSDGHAHSLEVWQGQNLVGGLYGLAMGGVFFGESMFTRADNASKCALVALVQLLQYHGFVLLDTQFLNDHLQRFGAVEVSRRKYKELLEAALTHQHTLPGYLTDIQIDLDQLESAASCK